MKMLFHFPNSNRFAHNAYVRCHFFLLSQHFGSIATGMLNSRFYINIPAIYIPLSLCCIYKYAKRIIMSHFTLWCRKKDDFFICFLEANVTGIKILHLCVVWMIREKYIYFSWWNSFFYEVNIGGNNKHLVFTVKYDVTMKCERNMLFISLNTMFNWTFTVVMP